MEEGVEIMALHMTAYTTRSWISSAQDDTVSRADLHLRCGNWVRCARRDTV